MRTTLQRSQSTDHARRGSPTGPLRVDFSPTSDRLDNRNYADGTKQSNEQQVTVRRRKTATERSERREHD
jgi:hypothetical protein